MRRAPRTSKMINLLILDLILARAVSGAFPAREIPEPTTRRGTVGGGAETIGTLPFQMLWPMAPPTANNHVTATAPSSTSAAPVLPVLGQDVVVRGASGKCRTE